MLRNFYLISNSSTDIYKNTLTKFTNHFGENEINIPHGEVWQISLDSIILHPLFINIPNLGYVPSFVVYDKGITTLELLDDAGLLGSSSLKEQHYTYQILIDSINQLFLNMKIKSSELKFELQEVDDKLKMKIKLEGDRYLIGVHHTLALQFGLISDKNDLNVSNSNNVGVRRQKYFFFQNSLIGEAFIKLRERIPKLIKVQLSNVESLIENDLHRPIISYHAINMITPQTHYRNFQRPLYLNLSSESIKSLTVTILDEKDEQLQIATNLPTVCHMHLRKMYKNNTEFPIIIDSTKENAHYPLNTGSDFCFTMNPPIHLEQTHLCSISSITFSTKFHNLAIRKNNSYIRVIRVVNKKMVSAQVPFNPENKYFNTVDELITELNANCKLPETHSKAKSLSHPALSGQFLSVVIKKDPVSKSDNVNLLGFNDTFYNLPEEVALVLGCRDGIVDGRFITKLNAIANSNLSGLRIMKSPDINAAKPHTLFIYTDFTEPTLVGDQMVNLLHIIPIKYPDSDKNHFVTEEFLRPNWVPVRNNMLNNLKFQILRSNGSPVEFMTKDDGVIITLMFKKMFSEK